MFSSNATQVSAAAGPNYIEDVFSTYLYTGTGASQFISNSIELGGGTSAGWIGILGASGQTGYSVAVGSSGSVYACGTSNASGTIDFQLAKFSSTGSLEWQRSLGSSSADYGQAIAVDSSENVYVCGYSNTSGNDNFQIAKYNSSGTIQWQRSLGGAGTEQGYSIAVDSSSNVYICGYSNASGTLDLQIAKYDTSGVIQWQRRLASATSDAGYGIAVDSSSNVYVCGTTGVSGTTEYLLAKYNTSGTIQWQRRLAAGPNCNSISVDGSGNVYICGYTTVGGTNDFQIAKYDTSGTIQWQQRFGSSSIERGQSVAVDSSGNVYVCGYSNVAGNNDVQLAKFNTSGTIQWQRSLASTTGNQIGYSIALDASNSIYVCGDAGPGFLLAKLPNDGSGIGPYTIGSASYTYTASSLTVTATTHTGTTSTLTDAATTLTDAATTLTDAASSLTFSAATFSTGKGGLVWLKGRSGATDHALYDTARGATFDLVSNSTAAQTTQTTGLTSFTSSGFAIGALAKLNTSTATYASWTFRKQAKFFDVVTWTGNGTLPRVIPHNLGSVPGCIIAKRTDIAADWYVYHRSLNGGSVPEFYWLLLNSTVATQGSGSIWGTIAPTSTGFNVGAALNTLPGSGITPTYVAYVFAHDAGGFGAAGTDNVISCGSFTTASSSTDVTLGYEPQFVLLKRTNSTSNWFMLDTMRGMDVNAAINDPVLYANTNGAEDTTTGILGGPTATGFNVQLSAGQTWIYIAIRRGPMKTPTTGTSVFSPLISSGATGTTLTTNFPVDMLLTKYRAGVASNPIVDRLRGVSTNSTEFGSVIYTNSTGAESGTAGESLNWNNTGFQIPSNWGGLSNVFYSFLRAPNFFDQVCYTGTGSATTFNHNLGIAPELMIVKRRSATSTWRVYATGMTSAAYALTLNSTAAEASLPTVWNSTAPTSSVFSVGTSTDTNASSGTYVAYLFATVTGVSKVGSYTGTGALQTINCGFTGGARFVLIKRTNSTGDWYVWDSARGISSGNDPYLLLNSTAAEVTTTNYVDTTSVGFQVTAAAPAALNASGGSYIFLAIA